MAESGRSGFRHENAISDIHLESFILKKILVDTSILAMHALANPQCQPQDGIEASATAK
jgi:hypothetical protein